MEKDFKALSAEIVDREITKHMRQSIYAEYVSEAAKQRAVEKLAYLTHKHALNVIGDIVSGKDEDASPDLRFKAAQELLNRYLGKPHESVEVNSSVNLRIDL